MENGGWSDWTILILTSTTVVNHHHSICPCLFPEDIRTMPVSAVRDVRVSINCNFICSIQRGVNEKKKKLWKKIIWFEKYARKKGKSLYRIIITRLKWHIQGFTWSEDLNFICNVLAQVQCILADLVERCVAVTLHNLSLSIFPGIL